VFDLNVATTLKYVAVSLALLAAPALPARESKNLSIEDIVVGFEKQRLFYFELLFENGKYSKGFNKCLSSRPVDFGLIRKFCWKNPAFKNAFEFPVTKELKAIWFVYDNKEECESIRQPMKEKMDALLN
jgi:hypothetical protein